MGYEIDRNRRRARSWARGAADLLAAGALAWALGGGAVLVEVPTALADGTPGELTINVPADSRPEGHTANANDAGKVRYNAYRIFSADVGLDSSAPGSKEVGKNRISNVAWASRTYRGAVVEFLKRWDASYEDPSDASESALKAAEYIANHIGERGEASPGSPSQDQKLQLGSGQFGSGLVTAIRGVGTIEPTPATDGTSELVPGTAYVFDDGWYLVVTSTKSVYDTTDSRSGSSPIFAVVGGDAVTVTEKGSVPTVDKRVKDDSRTGDADDDWGMAADAHAGQRVSYRLIGTVAGNIASYDSYYYRFTDEPGQGLVLDVKSGKGSANGDARVYLHKGHDPADASAAAGDRSCDVTDNFDFRVDAVGTMTAEAQDLRRLSVAGGGTYEMVAGDYLTLEYKARLSPAADGSGIAQGSTGTSNVARITYSNNPKTSSKGSSYGQDARVYTYSLHLHKQDKQNAARALRDAKFTLQVKRGDDAASNGKYVQADGSLADEPHKFATDEQGDILVRNLDAGTYELVETDAPPAEQASGNPDDAYELLDPATVVLGSNVTAATGADGRAYANGSISRQETGLQSLEVSCTASAPGGFGHGSTVDVADAIDASGAKTGDGLHPAVSDGSDSKAPNATVSLVVREAKETQMPLTGGAGIAAFALVGSFALAGGAALLTRRRASRADERES